MKLLPICNAFIASLALPGTSTLIQYFVACALVHFTQSGPTVHWTIPHTSVKIILTESWVFIKIGKHQWEHTDPVSSIMYGPWQRGWSYCISNNKTYNEANSRWETLQTAHCQIRISLHCPKISKFTGCFPDKSQNKHVAQRIHTILSDHASWHCQRLDSF